MANHNGKLTAERRERFFELIRGGASREAACNACGFTSGALRMWMRAAKAGDARYTEFADELRRVEAHVEADTVGIIRSHGDKDWRALAWWIERRFPASWGQDKVASNKLEAEREQMIEALVGALHRRGLSEVAEDVLADLAGGSGSEAADAPAAAAPRH